MQWAQKHKGFTIVELLIVVVVIAILAAITVVAYNGISQRSKDSALQSEVASAARAVEAFRAGSSMEMYPDSLEQAGVRSSASATLGYVPGNYQTPATFCVFGQNGNSRFFVSTTQRSPVSGGCTITNLVTNPNFSVNQNTWGTAGYGTGGSGSTTRIAGIGPTGGFAMRSEWTTASASAGHSSRLNVSHSVVSGRTYTASAWVRSNQPITSAMMRVEYGSQILNGELSTLQPGVWTRVFQTFTAIESVSAVNIAGRIHDLTGTSDGLQFDATNFMLNEGGLFTYADGSSPGWSWSGSAGGSRSSGPAL